MNYYSQNGELSKLDFVDTTNYSQEELIDMKKSVNQIVKDAKANTKPKKCLFCKKPTTSFCNSHSVPAFLLRNVSVDGDVYHTAKLIQSPVSSHKLGITNSGTFQLICRECDSKIFKDYETTSNYSTIPSDKMLNQIAMKNYLKYIYKRSNEVELYKLLKSKTHTKSNIETKYQISIEDLSKYISDFNASKRYLSNLGSNYCLLYYKNLDYIVPYAFQEKISLVCDLEDNIINDIYWNKKKIKDLHVCVFPLENSTQIFLFTDLRNTQYKKFKKQLENLNLDDQLKAINFMIFAYSEDIYIHKNVNEDVFLDEGLKNIAKLTYDYYGYSKPTARMAIKEYSFKHMHSLINLLSEKYCTR